MLLVYLAFLEDFEPLYYFSIQGDAKFRVKGEESGGQGKRKGKGQKERKKDDFSSLQRL